MRQDYIKHIKSTGKLDEYVSFCFAIGFKATEIAELFDMSRTQVYYHLNNYKEQLRKKGEEIKFYG